MLVKRLLMSGPSTGVKHPAQAVKEGAPARGKMFYRYWMLGANRLAQRSKSLQILAWLIAIVRRPKMTGDHVRSKEPRREWRTSLNEMTEITVLKEASTITSGRDRHFHHVRWKMLALE